MLNRDLDVVLNFENEQIRDEFMLVAIASEEPKINDEFVRYAGEKSILLNADQADKLSSLTKKYGGSRSSSVANFHPNPAPPRTIQDMIKSWDGLMEDIKRTNNLEP